MNKTTLIAILVISMLAVVQMKTLLVETADDTDDNAKVKKDDKPAEVGDYLAGSREEEDTDEYSGEYSEEDNNSTKYYRRNWN